MRSGYGHEKPDPTDWEQWLIEHVPALLLYARQQARCEADAQDLVQEAAVECWRRRPANGSPALPLAYATIRRRAIDLARSSDRRAAREHAALDDGPQAWFDQSLEERERGRALQQALAALPEIHREVITLKVWGGLTFEQIGDALEIPSNTAASRYRYGLEQLRGAVKEIFA